MLCISAFDSDQLQMNLREKKNYEKEGNQPDTCNFAECCNVCTKSIPIYAAEEIGTSAAADFFAEDSIENQSLNEGDAETNTETNIETNAETNTESNTETNTKADATTGISEAYTLEESNSATTSEETVTD